MSKPRIYGDPYRQLKEAGLLKKQYQHIKGQIRNGRADDSMRGLQRLMERRSQ
jgi:5-bromo-4-chloroindolyl phosphate hydrolysis protein